MTDRVLFNGKTFFKAFEQIPTEDFLQTFSEEKEEELTKTVISILESKGYTITPPTDEQWEDISFDTFWAAYDKKVARAKAEKLWQKLSKRDRRAALDYCEPYKLAQPDKQYRKNPDTFLRNKSWQDELVGITPTPPPTTPPPSAPEEEKPIGERWQKAKQQHEDRRDQMLYTRLIGMVRLIQSNPHSLCRGQLVSYYNDGTLQRLGIQWHP